MLTMPATIAAIVPLYNKGRYIQRAIDSILAQTYPIAELIVIDDGSTDDGPALVQAYDDPRIRLIAQTNQGPGAARNRGLAESQSDLVAFLDGDDEWLPDFLERGTAALAAHPDCALFAGTQYRWSNRQSFEDRWRSLGVETGPWRLPTEVPPEQLRSTIDFFHVSSILSRRWAIERLGGFYAQHHCTLGEDNYLWLQVALHYQVYRDLTPVAWYHTECSEWGIWTRKYCPPPPALSDPEPLRAQCPPTHRPLLEEYLGSLAVLTARRLARSGDRTTAYKLLGQFPTARNFEDYFKAQAELAIAAFPPGLARLQRRPIH